MMKNILYIFSAIVVTLFSLTSCGLEEPYTPEKNPDAVIEFVGRPVGFSNQEVTTKSTPNNLDNKVCNCYLLLFNSAGELVYITGGAATSIQSYRIPRDLTIEGNMTACYLVNIPKDFVNGIKTNGITLADLNTTVLDISYALYSSTMPMGVPLIDAEPCIPMYGELEFTATENTVLCQVPIKRLFAKVTIKMTMDLEDIGTLGGQRNTRFTLTSYTLSNLPTKVRLSEPTSQELSAGYETQYTSDGAYEDLQTYNVNKDIYNADAWGTNLNKSYSFDLYVPEYYLIPLTQEEFQEAHKNDEKYSSYTYNTQECKPKMFASTKKPISVNLLGTYKQGTGSGTANLNYDIYLGENNSSDFNLKRNKHYTNNVVITGIQNTELDCRVEVTDASDLISIYGEVANCYVISAAQDYSFKAYKGAYKYGQLTADKKCTGTTVEIIAQDKKGVTFADSNNPFTVREGDNGVKEISFTVTNISADCNMVIALMKDGTMEWSWHLWFIANLQLGTQGFFQLSSQGLPDNSTYMVDSNLGVVREIDGDWIGGGATGFYYKYGHRAPYFNDVVKGKQYHGFNEDDYYAWEGNDKSPTDPCPPGYKVPSITVWRDDNYNNATLEDAELKIGSLGINAMRYWNRGTGGTSDDIYYPYAGPMPASNYNSQTNTIYTSNDTEITSTETDVKYENYSKYEQLTGAGERDKKFTYTKYSDFKYTIDAVPDKLGQLAVSEEDEVLSYAYTSVTTSNFKKLCTFVQCKKTVYSVSVVEIGAFGVWTERSSTRKETFKSSDIITDASKLPNNWKDKLADKECVYDAIKIKTHKEIVTLATADSGDFGYQVRCVVE